MPNPYTNFGFPSPVFSGDVILNYNSELSYLYEISTSPGSLFHYISLHEFGHTLGLKHPHDDGGTGRPVFGSTHGLSKTLDADYYTVMSYNASHGGDTSKKSLIQKLLWF